MFYFIYCQFAKVGQTSLKWRNVSRHELYTAITGALCVFLFFFLPAWFLHDADVTDLQKTHGNLTGRIQILFLKPYSFYSFWTIVDYFNLVFKPAAIVIFCFVIFVNKFSLTLCMFIIFNLRLILCITWILSCFRLYSFLHSNFKVSYKLLRVMAKNKKQNGNMFLSFRSHPLGLFLPFVLMYHKYKCLNCLRFLIRQPCLSLSWRRFFFPVCGDFKEVKEVVALQRADRVHEVTVHKHIVGICSIQSEGLAIELCWHTYACIWSRIGKWWWFSVSGG